VSFQVLKWVSNKHERSSDPAVSGKKVIPGVKQFRSRFFFRNSRISATKGINFFTYVQDLFDEALSPQCGASHFGSIGIKGNVLRGWVVPDIILSEILIQSCEPVF